MKTKSLFNPVVMGHLFTLEEICGEAENIPGTDFKEFSKFTLNIAVAGGEEFTLLTFSREQYDGDTWGTDFRVDQLTEGLPGVDGLKVAIAENEAAIVEAINEFIDDYENQNID